MNLRKKENTAQAFGVGIACSKDLERLIGTNHPAGLGRRCQGEFNPGCCSEHATWLAGFQARPRPVCSRRRRSDETPDHATFRRAGWLSILCVREYSRCRPGSRLPLEGRDRRMACLPASRPMTGKVRISAVFEMDHGCRCNCLKICPDIWRNVRFILSRQIGPKDTSRCFCEADSKNVRFFTYVSSKTFGRLWRGIRNGWPASGSAHFRTRNASSNTPIYLRKYRYRSTVDYRRRLSSSSAENGRAIQTRSVDRPAGITISG